MDARDLRLRHREHAERIIVAQVRLGGERKLREVAERLEVVGVNTGGVELGTVVRHVVVGMAQRPGQAVALPCPQLVGRCQLVAIEIRGLGLELSQLAEWNLQHVSLPGRRLLV